jgi:hypothetical protein
MTFSESEAIMGTATTARIGRVTALVAATAALLAVTVTASHAAAMRPAVFCNGGGCDYLDPENEGCTPDATDRAEFTERGVRVVLWYSPSCQAQWVTFYNPLSSAPGYLYAQMDVWTASSGGSDIAVLNAQIEDSNGDTWSNGWTGMWSNAYWAQACMSGSSTGPSNPSLCTDRH